MAATSDLELETGGMDAGQSGGIFRAEGFMLSRRRNALRMQYFFTQRGGGGAS